MDDVIANRTQEAELTLAIAGGASALAYADLPAPVRALARNWCLLLRLIAPRLNEALTNWWG